jgi:hypothetical protein
MKIKTKDLNLEFLYLKENTILSITEEKIDATKHLLYVYNELINSFVAQMKSLGADYDLETAKREGGLFESEWPEINWLRECIRAIIDESAHVGNSEHHRRKPQHNCSHSGFTRMEDLLRR